MPVCTQCRGLVFAHWHFTISGPHLKHDIFECPAFAWVRCELCILPWRHETISSWEYPSIYVSSNWEFCQHYLHRSDNIICLANVGLSCLFQDFVGWSRPGFQPSSGLWVARSASSSFLCYIILFKIHYLFRLHPKFRDNFYCFLLIIETY